MLFAQRLSDHTKVCEFINGAEIARGTVGTTVAGTPDLQDLTTDAFLDVDVGDQVFISGEDPTTIFLVDTKTNDNNLILDNLVIADHTADAMWRICRGGIGMDAVYEIQFDIAGHEYVVFYERTTFVNG